MIDVLPQIEKYYFEKMGRYPFYPTDWLEQNIVDLRAVPEGLPVCRNKYNIRAMSQRDNRFPKILILYKLWQCGAIMGNYEKVHVIINQ